MAGWLDEGNGRENCRGHPVAFSPVSNTFQVDLRGIVDLLSHHLYASPRVYVRELLQNAVDAITATGSAETGAIQISTGRITTGADGLRITDNGIGLT